MTGKILLKRYSFACLIKMCDLWLFSVLYVFSSNLWTVSDQWSASWTQEHNLYFPTYGKCLCRKKKGRTKILYRRINIWQMLKLLKTSALKTHKRTKSWICISYTSAASCSNKRKKKQKHEYVYPTCQLLLWQGRALQEKKVVNMYILHISCFLMQGTVRIVKHT